MSEATMGSRIPQAKAFYQQMMTSKGLKAHVESELGIDTVLPVSAFESDDWANVGKFLDTLYLCRARINQLIHHAELRFRGLARQTEFFPEERVDLPAMRKEAIEHAIEGIPLCPVCTMPLEGAPAPECDRKSKHRALEGARSPAAASSPSSKSKKSAKKRAKKKSAARRGSSRKAGGAA